MDDHGLTHFKLELEDSKLELRKGADIDIDAVQKLMSLAPAHHYAHPAPAPVAAPAVGPAVPPPSSLVGIEPSGEGPGPGEIEIKSELVGTFYRSPSPDADPFVKEGSEITEETVVCIVEAMKVMNQIQAGVSGKITKALVENGTPVQYGDPLFYVKPS
ncbi:MAG: acetyl-CoA carboxylase biotin carboxyl carrier protein [Verrucomicrobiae bacterium]|nr:acetyl-CoA carboxylase biotin carboxyl carrier protein [Verrucomicrobiae bacterium]